MSGLEKFQTSEAWRTNFKQFLFMERKPENVKNTLAVTESQRYSLDIGEDLKNIIKQKKNQKTVQITSDKENIIIPNVSTETNRQSGQNILIENISDKENINDNENMERYDNTACGDKSFQALQMMSEKSVKNPNSTLFKYGYIDGVKKSNNVLVWNKASDESFEALEKMCDKTASDPNSTLFHYLHSDRKDQILADAKKRSAEGLVLNVQEQEDQLLMKINNCTLLDDIEAPSRMWENTICGDTILQTSPVKMVGLLRPSTIMEEVLDDSANSDMSSHMSFLTATKSAQTDVSSSTYETAHESSEATIVEKAYLSYECEAEKYLTNDISVDLIDLERTVGPLQYPSQSLIVEEIFSKNREGQESCSVENKLDDSIIEILSDEEDVVNFDSISINNHNIKAEINSQPFDLNHDTYSFNKTKENDKENCLATQELSEKSIQFNDTMEEVEYMLKKGIEYMTAEAAAMKSPENKKGLIKQTYINGSSRIEQKPPMEYTNTIKNLSSASKAQSTIYATPVKKTPLTKGHNMSSKKFNVDIGLFPKLDVFLKPTVHTRTKELSSKLQKFSHIVSPVGAYMKKTAQRPLMSSIGCKNNDYFNSSAILQLENESRLYQTQLERLSDESATKGIPKLPGLANGTIRALPKKAYISSDLKHIVDDRTPITIPGGKKIQKYLENAMMPAVLRHEGKFKMPGGISNKLNSPTSFSSGSHPTFHLKSSDVNSTAATQPTQRNNASLADLSIMSGDVSMYTIMDAQKF